MNTKNYVTLDDYLAEITSKDNNRSAERVREIVEASRSANKRTRENAYTVLHAYLEKISKRKGEHKREKEIYRDAFLHIFGITNIAHHGIDNDPGWNLQKEYDMFEEAWNRNYDEAKKELDAFYSNQEVA